MVLPIYDPTILGCPQPSGFTVSRRDATSGHPTLKGRPRHTLRDLHPVYTVALVVPMTEAQFASFVMFWELSIDHGALDFMMDIYLDDRFYPMTCHATAPYVAGVATGTMWRDTALTLEARL